MAGVGGRQGCDGLWGVGGGTIGGNGGQGRDWAARLRHHST